MACAMTRRRPFEEIGNGKSHKWSLAPKEETPKAVTIKPKAA